MSMANPKAKRLSRKTILHILTGSIAAYKAGDLIKTFREEGARVIAVMTDAVKRFPTGTYAVWYPLIPRPEAHDLPKKLKTLAQREGRGWLDATLTVKSSKLLTNEQGDVIRPGLPASGMFVINPPYTLHAELKAALPQMVEWLGQDRNAGFTLTHGS